MVSVLLALTIAQAAPVIGTEAAPPLAPGQEEAVFAAGCFWCVEAAYDGVPGVVSASSGYTGGTLPNPSYAQVSHTETGHIEAVRVVYDPAKISYDLLLYIFWRNVDPFDHDGQFCDQGPSYQPAIFVKGETQRQAAVASRTVVEKQLGRAVQVPIRDASTFWLAEDYHQDYHSKNSVKYSYYRWGCGRDKRLSEVWGTEAGGGVKH